MHQSVESYRILYYEVKVCLEILDSGIQSLAEVLFQRVQIHRSLNYFVVSRNVLCNGIHRFGEGFGVLIILSNQAVNQVTEQDLSGVGYV